MKQRTYNVCNDVKYAHRLIPIVTAPNQSADGKPRVLWSKFHDTVPVDDSSAAGRAGSISIWPEQGQLPDPAGGLHLTRHCVMYSTAASASVALVQAKRNDLLADHLSFCAHPHDSCLMYVKPDGRQFSSMYAASPLIVPEWLDYWTGYSSRHQPKLAPDMLLPLSKAS